MSGDLAAVPIRDALLLQKRCLREYRIPETILPEAIQPNKIQVRSVPISNHATRETRMERQAGSEWRDGSS